MSKRMSRRCLVVAAVSALTLVSVGAHAQSDLSRYDISRNPYAIDFDKLEQEARQEQSTQKNQRQQVCERELARTVSSPKRVKFVGERPGREGPVVLITAEVPRMFGPARLARFACHLKSGELWRFEEID